MVLVTDEQADEIKRALSGGVRGGPVLIKWLEQLLEDRAHRIRIARVLVNSRLPSGQGVAPAHPAAAPSGDDRT